MKAISEKNILNELLDHFYDSNPDYKAKIADPEVKWPKIKGYSGKLIDFSRSPTIEDRNQSIDEACVHLLDEGWYAVINTKKEISFGMVWDKNIFPYIWIWRVYGKGCQVAPWWGPRILYGIRAQLKFLTNWFKRGDRK